MTFWLNLFLWRAVLPIVSAYIGVQIVFALAGKYMQVIQHILNSI